MIYKPRKKMNMIGYRMGKIFVSKELSRKSGHRRYILKCSICGKEKKVYHTQINSGLWNVCEHDTL